MSAGDEAPRSDALRIYQEEFSREFGARVESWSRYYAGVFAEVEAMAIEEAARQSLHPRLRWAVRYPRVMRLLRAVGLWRPPTACYQGGMLIGFTRRGNG